MPGEQRIGSGGPAADERQQEEVADERGSGNGEHQRDRGHTVPEGQQCGGDHKAAAGQEWQQCVTGYGEKSDSGDEPGLDCEHAHLDLHGSIVSNVQIVVNRQK
ncbi:hypothetical protein [Streptomyces chartreusis]|uniref:hypothetical protein n=1 Tax=Streptomyces chartreusis TaxID=1969 RepID=UPI0036318D27